MDNLVLKESLNHGGRIDLEKQGEDFDVFLVVMVKTLEESQVRRHRLLYGEQVVKTSASLHGAQRAMREFADKQVKLMQKAKPSPCRYDYENHIVIEGVSKLSGGRRDYDLSIQKVTLDRFPALKGTPACAE